MSVSPVSVFVHIKSRVLWNLWDLISGPQIFQQKTVPSLFSPCMYVYF